MLVLNQVYRYCNTSEEIRIIEFKDNHLAYYVPLKGQTVIPKKVKMLELQEEINDEILIAIPDPYFKHLIDEDFSKEVIQKRDNDWLIIDSGWKQHKSEILTTKSFKKILKEISEESGIREITLRRMFTRFWQRGLNKNSLLPDYRNSGGKGKERNHQKFKNGRPRQYSSTSGIIITDEVKKLIRLVIKKYYRKIKNLTIKGTYEYLLRDFYSDKYYEGNQEKYVIWDESRIPSYRQFLYWFKKFEDPILDFQARSSQKEFELNHRFLSSNSTSEAKGPGEKFQVDATIADIFLVSSFDRTKIIGRPIVYGIIDVYSRMMTGIYVGLEGPSWLGAMMALDNMIMDKVDYCKSFDIELSESQWPAQHIPKIILADRGEFEGYSVNKLINNLNITVQNTPPYRGDLKAIIERQFRTINERIKRKAPGAIQKEYRIRGEKDYRLDATLNIKEFTKIIIHLVLQHNQKVIEKYPLEKQMIIEGVTPTPTNLWHWGMHNRSGQLRKVQNREIFLLNILPSARAKITREGIKFKKLFYGSEKFLAENWFVTKKGQGIEVAYDPRNLNYIYIPHKDGVGYDICYLLDKSSVYENYSIDEYEFIKGLEQEAKQSEKKTQTELTINTDVAIENIVKEAGKSKKESNPNYKKVSRKEKLKGIRENRQIEKLINKKQESFKLVSDSKILPKLASDQIDNAHNQKESERINKPSKHKSLMETLRKQRDEDYGRE